MQFNNQQTVASVSQGGVLARNKVLRQTYILLAINVLFSALCAYAGMVAGLKGINPILYLVGVFGLSWLVSANRNSGLGIIFLFAFTGFLGMALSGILSSFFGAGMGNVVVKALVGTAVIFFSLSAYVVISGKNFSFLGAFLVAGLVIVLLGSIAAMFFSMPGLHIAISAAALLLFSGYVLYDTSNIIHGAETNYILATMTLFINIFQIFIQLLNILSVFGRD